MLDTQRGLRAAILDNRKNLSAEERLAALHALRENKKNAVQDIGLIEQDVLKDHLARFWSETIKLKDPEAPDLGRDFLAAVERSGCVFEPRHGMSCVAAYTAYIHGEGGGLSNRVGLDPNQLTGDFNAFASSARHEIIHALQRPNAEALQHSPFNPATKIIVHPADWIRLEKICEADAYAKQAFFNAIEAVDTPSVRVLSRPDLVSVEDFERHRSRAWSLENALVNSALNALSKPKRRNDHSETFHDHYHHVSIDNYTRAMGSRASAGERNLMFVRLEPEDFHKVGNYGVGPNALGERFVDPQFLAAPNLSYLHEAMYKDLCRRYDIPPLDACPTLGEAKQRQGVSAAVEMIPQIAAYITKPESQQPAFA